MQLKPQRSVCQVSSTNDSIVQISALKNRPRGLRLVSQYLTGFGAWELGRSPEGGTRRILLPHAINSGANQG